MERFKLIMLFVAAFFVNTSFAQSGNDNYDIRLKQHAKQIANYLKLISDKDIPLLDRHHYCLQAMKLFPPNTEIQVEGAENTNRTVPLPDYLFDLAINVRTVVIKSVSYALYEQAQIIQSEPDSYLCTASVAEYRNGIISRTNKTIRVRMDKSDRSAKRPIVVATVVSDSGFVVGRRNFDDTTIGRDSVLKCQLEIIGKVAPIATVSIHKKDRRTSADVSVFCYNDAFDVSTSFFCKIINDGEKQKIDSAYMSVPDTELYTKIIFQNTNENDNQ